MKVLVLALLLIGCGKLAPEVKVKGGTEHTANVNVNGEVKTTNEFVLRIDVSGCQGLPDQDHTSCIQETVKALGDLVQLIKEATTQQKQLESK